MLWFSDTVVFKYAGQSVWACGQTVTWGNWVYIAVFQLMILLFKTCLDIRLHSFVYNIYTILHLSPLCLLSVAHETLTHAMTHS